MKIILLFPPQADITHPYLALPMLTAYLKQHGFNNVVQKDPNIEFHNEILTPHRLSTAFTKVSEEFERLHNKQGPLTPEDMFKYFRLMSVKGAPYLIDNVERACRIIRNEEEFVHQWPNALRIIEEAMLLVSNEFFPTHLAFRDYLSGYSRVSTADIIKAVFDRGHNMFYTFFEQHTVPFIVEESPELIGISITYDSQIIPAFTLACMIKQKLKNVHITIGGRVFTYLQNVVVQNERLFSFVDSFIVFEGEQPLYELACHLKEGGDLSKVPNLIFKKKDKIYSTVNTVRSNPPNLDDLPTPDFDGIPLNLFFAPEAVLPLQTSRGCYWGKCAFCDRSYFYRGSVRQRSAEKLCEDIKVLSSKYNTRFFYFSNEAETPERLGDLSRLLIEHNLNIRWGSDARLDKGFTKKVCNLLAMSGCHSLYMGLESGSQRVLDAMNKGIVFKDVPDIIRNIHRAGIFVYLFNFQGFPLETESDANQTYAFIRKNFPWIDYSTGGVFHLRRASNIWEHPERYGVSLSDTNTMFDLAVDFEYLAKSGIQMQEAEELVRGWEEKEVPLKFRHIVYTAKPLMFFLDRDSYHRVNSGHGGTYVFLNEDDIPRISHELLMIKMRLSHSQYEYIKRLYQLNLIRRSWVQGRVPLYDIVGSLNLREEKRGAFVFSRKTVEWSCLSPEEECILNLCNGERTVRDIVQYCTDREICSDTLSLLRVFLSEGFIELLETDSTIPGRCLRDGQG